MIKKVYKWKAISRRSQVSWEDDLTLSWMWRHGMSAEIARWIVTFLSVTLMPCSQKLDYGNQRPQSLKRHNPVCYLGWRPVKPLWRIRSSLTCRHIHCVHTHLLSSDGERHMWLSKRICYVSICLFVPFIRRCRPRWSRGNVLASRSKVRWFKSGWGRWIFSGRKNPEHKSSGGTLSWGSRVWDFRLVKEPQTWKNRPLSKI